MMERFRPEKNVWPGISSGADVLFQAGRHMVQKYLICRCRGEVFAGIVPDYEMSFLR